MLLQKRFACKPLHLHPRDAPYINQRGTHYTELSGINLYLGMCPLSHFLRVYMTSQHHDLSCSNICQVYELDEIVGI